MKQRFGLLLGPLLILSPALLFNTLIPQGAGSAMAGVVYDIATRSVDQSNLALVSPNVPPAPAVVTRYFVEDGNVRVGGPDAKIAYLFKDRTMYVIDNSAHLVHVLKHATLGQLATHYAEAVKQLEEAAAKAGPDEREEARRKAADMREVSDRMRQPVAHDYKVTVRFESVDGHACRIWEERENDAKRLELCVAPTGTIPGGADILGAMKTLSQFRQGSNFAFGVDFGISDWWPDFVTVGGVPLLVREFKYDSEVSEVMLSAMHQGVQSTTLFELPGAYQTQEGPDYTLWYMKR